MSNNNEKYERIEKCRNATEKDSRFPLKIKKPTTKRDSSQIVSNSGLVRKKKNEEALLKSALTGLTE